MTTRAKQQLTPEARNALFQHLKNDDIKERRFTLEHSKPRSFRLMMVSRDFCVAARHALRHSKLQITSWHDSEPRWVFDAYGGRTFTHASALAFMSLVKPRFRHLIIAGSNNLEPEIDDQFIRSHFVGIPKLTITSYDELKPHIHRLIVLMGPKLKSLACSAKYLEPAENFPLLTLNEYTFCVDAYDKPENMDFVLAHRIEKIQLVLVGGAQIDSLVLSENGPVQPSLKVLVLTHQSNSPLLLPQWFYTRVPNLKMVNANTSS
ncbi:hypothetical protein M3Y95_00843300 [Aphelenchoides besseyi]|nr:hypothetical protein M3Y95_00843300 [Aphelenchoides besseyi]